MTTSAPGPFPSSTSPPPTGPGPYPGSPPPTGRASYPGSPPPTGRAPYPGSPPPPAAAASAPERGPWRQYLPELLATVGAALVAFAVGGFLSARWATIDEIQKAMVLGAAAAALTAAGLWADQRRHAAFEFVVATTLATATLLVAAGVTLAAATTWPGAGRVAIGLGGAAALAHAAVLLRRRPESILQQVALFAAAVYAAGPFGTALADRFTWQDTRLLGTPLLGLTDPFIRSEAFVLTGLAHLVIGVAWLGLSRLVPHRASAAAKTLGTLTVGFAALELNVLTSPVGAVAALAVVLAYLLYGVWAEDSVLVVVGAVGAFVAGVRVLAALFSGEVVVTILVFTGGLTMLAWAIRLMRRRQQMGDGQQEDGQQLASPSGETDEVRP